MSDATIRPTLSALFLGFLTIGLCGFGGVLPWARWLMVERRRWLTGAEFTDLMGLCQFLPGPNVINLSVAFGARHHGVVGSCVAFTGLMAGPVVIVLILAAVYDRFAELPWVRDGFIGLAATASGLVVSMALKIAAPLWGRPAAIAVALATFAAIIGPRWALLNVLAVMVPVSLLLARAGRL